MISTYVLLLLNYSNASVLLPQAVAERDFDFLAVTLGLTTGLCFTTFASGYGLTRLFRMGQTERLLLINGLSRNYNGTELVVTSLVLTSYPSVMVPIILYNLIQHLVAGIVYPVIGRSVVSQ